MVVVVSGRLHKYHGPRVKLLDVLKNKQELSRILRNHVLVEVVLILPAGRSVSQQDVGLLRLVEWFDNLHGWGGSWAVVETQ